MSDIHMHIIPGVDDGAWNFDMAYRMLYMAYDQGIRKIIATPHSSAFQCHSDEAKSAYQTLKEQIDKRYPDMGFYIGCEVYCRKENMDDILEKLENGTFPTMNETKYVLTEFSSLVSPEEAIDCIKALQEKGWTPIIAHVERYKGLQYLYANFDAEYIDEIAFRNGDRYLEMAKTSER